MKFFSSEFKIHEENNNFYLPAVEYSAKWLLSLVSLLCLHFRTTQSGHEMLEVADPLITQQTVMSMVE